MLKLIITTVIFIIIVSVLMYSLINLFMLLTNNKCVSVSKLKKLLGIFLISAMLMVHSIIVLSKASPQDNSVNSVIIMTLLFVVIPILAVGWELGKLTNDVRNKLKQKNN